MCVCMCLKCVCAWHIKKNKFLKLRNDLREKFSKHVSCLCTHDTSEDEVFTDNQKEADYFHLTSASLASSHEAPLSRAFSFARPPSSVVPYRAQ